jgi:hypothetical protein
MKNLLKALSMFAMVLVPRVSLACFDTYLFGLASGDKPRGNIGLDEYGLRAVGNVFRNAGGFYNLDLILEHTGSLTLGTGSSKVTRGRASSWAPASESVSTFRTN